MKKIIYSVIISMMSSALLAQSNTGEIKGKVFELGTNEPMPSANVYVTAGENIIGCVTDLDGKFTLKPLQPGTYNLRVTFMGYDTIRLNGVEVNSDKITFTQDLFLSEGQLLGEVIIPWKHKLIDPEDTKITTISAKEIQSSPNRRDISQMAQSYSSEITTSEDGNEIYFRGSRNGDVIYYVDGVKSRDKPLLPASSIHSMRIYTGGVPAKYGDMMGGVIMVETKNYFDYYNIWKARQEMEKKD